MNGELCEKLSVFCTALFGIASCSALTAGTLTLGGAAAVLSLPAIVGVLRRDSSGMQGTVNEVARDIEANWRSWVDAGAEWSDNDVEQATFALGRVLDLLSPDPQLLIRHGRINDSVVEELIIAARAKAPQFYAIILADGRRNPDGVHVDNNTLFLRSLLAETIARLEGNPRHEAAIVPWFQRDVLGRLAEIGETGDDTNKRVRHLQQMVEMLLARLEAAGDTARIEAAGLPAEIVIELARRVSKDVADLDQAFAELERAVSIAIDFKAQAERGSNLGDFADVVIARMADLTAQSRFEEASAEADRAFRQWQEGESARREDARQVGLKLLNAGMQQDMLRRDPVAVARRAAALVDLEMPDPTARFEALRQVQDECYVRGRDRGLSLDLSVSMEIARIAVDRASDAVERGTALNDLGVSLQFLGERAGGPAGEDFLNEAVAAYDAALEVYARDVTPAQWAMTLGNRANALTILGQRADGAAGDAFLKNAVAAYDSALEVFAGETMPADRAKTQVNRAIVLQTLGHRAGGPAGEAFLKQAVAAYDAALEVYTRETIPADWAITQVNRANALLRLGERASSAAGEAFLREAVTAYDSALEVITRDAMPAQWAMTQGNRANALRNLGERAGGAAGEASLKDAVAAYDAALEVFTRDAMPAQWATAQMNRANVLSTLGGHAGGAAGEAFLQQSVAAYDAALEIRTRDTVPAQWAMTQVNRANALQTLGERAGGAAGKAFLEEAVAAYEAALEVFGEPSMEYYAEVARDNRAIAVAALDRLAKE